MKKTVWKQDQDQNFTNEYLGQKVDIYNWYRFTVNTLGLLPHTAVLLSVHKTADLSSSMDKLLVWIELRTPAVLWTNSRTAGPQQFYGHFSAPPEQVSIKLRT